MTSPSTDIESVADRGTGMLSVDLDALAANYRRLRGELGGVDCGACVKADAYGLGLEPVVKTLWQEGCREFFVSFVDGGIRLRALLPDAAIHVFTGVSGGPAAEFDAHRLIPVLNSLRDLEIWKRYCRAAEKALPADLHIDTGMSRLGLPQDEAARIVSETAILDGVILDLVMSHLASADLADSPQSLEQRHEFDAVRQRLTGQGRRFRSSFANSSGIFWGPDFHYDLARPGAAIYGVNPTPHATSPVAQVIKLKGKILQIRSVDTPRSVGYGATFAADGPMRIATVGVGYADGYLRSLSSAGSAWIDGDEAPIVGRISMDLITLDVSKIAERKLAVGSYATLIGDSYDINAIARDAGTIGYEILTSLGQRYRRTYAGGALS